jgi:hypothetical protein
MLATTGNDGAKLAEGCLHGLTIEQGLVAPSWQQKLATLAVQSTVLVVGRVVPMHQQSALGALEAEGC